MTVERPRPQIKLSANRQPASRLYHLFLTLNPAASVPLGPDLQRCPFKSGFFRLCCRLYPSECCVYSPSAPVGPVLVACVQLCSLFLFYFLVLTSVPHAKMRHARLESLPRFSPPPPGAAQSRLQLYVEACVHHFTDSLHSLCCCWDTSAPSVSVIDPFIGDIRAVPVVLLPACLH